MFDLEASHHEAAHCVLARHFGVRVTELRVDEPYGAAGVCTTDLDGWFPDGTFGGRSLERVATAIGAEVWMRTFERKRFPRASGFGSDRAAVTAILRSGFPKGADTFDFRRRAEKLATQVLEERRVDVLAVADRLAKFGRFDARNGWTQAPAPRRQVARPVLQRAAPAFRFSSAYKEQLRAELADLVSSGRIPSAEAHRRWEAAGYRARAVRSA